MTEETKDIVDRLEEDLDYTAAKQFFTELAGIKQQIYSSRAPMNSLLLLGVRRTATGLLHRYQKSDLLRGETIETKLSNYSKKANIVFVMSKGLQSHMEKFIKSTINNKGESNGEV